MIRKYLLGICLVLLAISPVIAAQCFDVDIEKMKLSDDLVCRGTPIEATAIISVECENDPRLTLTWYIDEKYYYSSDVFVEERKTITELIETDNLSVGTHSIKLTVASACSCEAKSKKIYFTVKEPNIYDYFVSTPTLSKSEVISGCCCKEIYAKTKVTAEGEVKEPVTVFLTLYVYYNPSRTGYPLLKEKKNVNVIPGSERGTRIYFNPRDLEGGTYYVFIKGVFKESSCGEQKTEWSSFSELEVNPLCESFNCPECPSCPECSECPATSQTQTNCNLVYWTVIGLIAILVVLTVVLITSRRKNNNGPEEFANK